MAIALEKKVVEKDIEVLSLKESVKSTEERVIAAEAKLVAAEVKNTELENQLKEEKVKSKDLIDKYD